LAEHLAAVKLEAAVEVVQLHLGELPRHPVEGQRRQLLAGRVAPLALPPRDEVEVAALERGEEARDLLGVVLQVTVDGEDEPAAAVVDPRRKRRRLAEVAAQAHQLDARIALARLAYPQ